MKKRDRNHSGFIALFLNKKHALFIAVLVVFRLVPGAVAGEIQLRTGVRLTKGTGDLDVGSYAIPCAADWNGDARKDLLVGYQTDGKISLFLNAGPDDAPVFTNGSPIKANGADIVHVSAGNCGAPVPFVCDYNNDGKRDLLVGEGAVG